MFKKINLNYVILKSQTESITKYTRDCSSASLSFKHIPAMKCYIILEKKIYMCPLCDALAKNNKT